jgi:hypothetical protein
VMLSATKQPTRSRPAGLIVPTWVGRLHAGPYMLLLTGSETSVAWTTKDEAPFWSKVISQLPAIGGVVGGVVLADELPPPQLHSNSVSKITASRIASLPILVLSFDDHLSLA